MKKYKLLALLLAVLLVFSISPFNIVYAVEENTASVQAQQEQTQKTEEFVLPDIVEETEAAERGYIGRAREEEKDNYTFVFKDSENMRTMRVYSHPVKYTDEDGNIKDITLDIKSRTGGGFETKDNNIKTTFGSRLSEGIRLQHENVDIKLIPANKNIAPVLSEDNKTVSYTLDEKTSLEYSLTYTGFKEDIVVSEYTGQTEYEFLLYTNGLTVKEEMGSYYLADSEGNRKANIGDIIIFTADERNNTLGSLSCEEIKPNYAYLLTIHVDAEYLKDEKTVYPIRIDPTFEITSATTEGAIEDVTVYTGASYFSGTLGILYLGTADNYKYRVMMRFPNLDLTGITAAQITNATVEFRDVMCQSVPITMQCRYYTGSATAWSESGTTTWSSIGGDTYVGSLICIKNIYYGNGDEGSDINRYSFNITNAARAWANGTYSPKQGFIFKASDESFSSTEDRLKYFGSYNRSDYQTSLTVQYFSLVCWPADNDSVGYWLSAPSIYTEKIHNVSSFYFEQGCVSAHAQWTSALNINLLSGVKNSANIHVYGATREQISTLFGKTISPTGTGLTSYWSQELYTVNFNNEEKKIVNMTSAIIYIVSKDKTLNEQIETVVHEFGHALGYLGHSTNTTDVMYTYLHSSYTLKTNDIQHLSQIYSMMYN